MTCAMSLRLYIVHKETAERNMYATFDFRLASQTQPTPERIVFCIMYDTESDPHWVSGLAYETRRGLHTSL